MNGVINVYKEKGFTSFDVVAKLRGILKTKKIGHTGTLDPDAEGVLPICVGTATGLCSILTEKDKVYETVLLLGKVTDTQDCTGNIVSVSEQFPNREELLKVLEQFTGTYHQLPPMYSAIKVQGRRLYELAREGKVVERATRPVTIYKIQAGQFLTGRDKNGAEIVTEVSMRVFCSKGTYIRTLCHDIGETLGCGGCMKQLIRIQSGCFTVEKSLRLAEIEKAAAAKRLQELLIPSDSLLPYPALAVTEDKKHLLLNGNPLAKQETLHYQAAIEPELSEEKNERVRMYLPDGKFAGVYEWKPEKNRYYPVRMFLTSRPDESTFK